MAKHINHSNYLEHIKHIPTIEGLKQQQADFNDLLNAISSKNIAFAYAPGKWTIGQVIGHIIDVERIMVYRALSFSRGETGHLPPFDEDLYVANAGFQKRSKQSLKSEFNAVRKATLVLYKSLSTAQKERIGHFSNNTKTVEEIFRVVLGHTQHHMMIVNERYL